jgi:pimeloyl-ACP methyl ester carboxylesterase
LASPLARAECYLPTARALARVGQAHLVELPGSGPGERLPAPWSLGDYAAWAADEIAGLAPERPVVIGHSYSGMLPVALAARRPEAVGGLVVADAPGAGAPTSLWRAALGAAADVALDFGIVARMWPYVAGNALVHAGNFLALIRESFAADLRGVARLVTAPSLVAWGGNDSTVPRRAAAEYAACLPRSKLYISPRGAHTWVISQPEEFARAVAEFMVRADLGT